MGPADTMSTITMSSSSESTSLAVPKLRNNGSNWPDYEPRLQKAMGSKGLWRCSIFLILSCLPMSFHYF